MQSTTKSERESAFGGRPNKTDRIERTISFVSDQFRGTTAADNKTPSSNALDMPSRGKSIKNMKKGFIGLSKRLPKRKFRVAVFVVMAAMRLRTTLTLTENTALREFYDRSGGLKTFPAIREALTDLGQNLDDESIHFTLSTTLGWRGDGHVLSYQRFRAFFLVRKRFLALADAQADSTQDTFKALGGDTAAKESTIDAQRLKDSADIFGLTVDVDKILAGMDKQITDEINFDEFKVMFQDRLNPLPQGTSPRDRANLVGLDAKKKRSSRVGPEGLGLAPPRPPPWWTSVDDDKWWENLERWMIEGQHEPKQIKKKDVATVNKKKKPGLMEELLEASMARKRELLLTPAAPTKHRIAGSLGASQCRTPLSASQLRDGSSIPEALSGFHAIPSHALFSPTSRDRGEASLGSLGSARGSPHGHLLSMNSTANFASSPTHLTVGARGTRASFGVASVDQQESSNRYVRSDDMEASRGDVDVPPGLYTEMTIADARANGLFVPEGYESGQTLHYAPGQVNPLELSVGTSEHQQQRQAKAELGTGGSAHMLREMREYERQQRRLGDFESPARPKSPPNWKDFIGRMEKDAEGKKQRRAQSATLARKRDPATADPTCSPSKMTKHSYAFDVSMSTLQPKDCFSDPPKPDALWKAKARTIKSKGQNAHHTPLSTRPPFDHSRPSTAVNLRTPSILRGPSAVRPSTAGLVKSETSSGSLAGVGGGLLKSRSSAGSMSRPASAAAVMTTTTTADRPPLAADSSPPPRTAAVGPVNLAKWMRGGQHADRPSLHKT